MSVATREFSLLDKPVGLKIVKSHVHDAAFFAVNVSCKDPRYHYDQFGNKVGDRDLPAMNLFYNGMVKWKKKSSKAFTQRSFPASSKLLLLP